MSVKYPTCNRHHLTIVRGMCIFISLTPELFLLLAKEQNGPRKWRHVSVTRRRDMTAQKEHTTHSRREK